jgi:uncharacterized protein YxeA
MRILIVLVLLLIISIVGFMLYDINEYKREHDKQERLHKIEQEKEEYEKKLQRQKAREAANNK